jgi:hypothetical protein
MTDYALEALKRKRAEITGEIARCHASLAKKQVKRTLEDSWHCQCYSASRQKKGDGLPTHPLSATTILAIAGGQSLKSTGILPV